MKPSSRSVVLHAKTWVRDSHGLFDYESQHVESNSYEARASGVLVRAGDHVRLHSDSEAASSSGPSILTLRKADSTDYTDSYFVQPCNDDLWLVVRFMDNAEQGQVLQRDHVVKLGRARYRVKEIQDGSEEPRPISPNTETSEGEQEVEEIPEEREETTCRICYDRQHDKDNPLLSHCKCDGSVKYIHLQCLKQWLRSKVTVRSSENSTTYHWKFLECEICKTELPLAVKFKGASLSLFDIEKPQAPYIVLEAVPGDHSANKAMHVISMSNGKQSIRIGRGHDSDVRINNDISVSRCHAMIRFQEGKFVMQDNSSKFGTLVRVTEPIRVPKDGKITLQVGRTLIVLSERPESVKFRGAMIREVNVNEVHI